jgi:hypothetical protein
MAPLQSNTSSLQYPIVSHRWDVALSTLLAWLSLPDKRSLVGFMYGVPTQEGEKWPLSPLRFVKDEFYGAPVDTNFPHRVLYGHR